MSDASKAAAEEHPVTAPPASLWRHRDFMLLWSGQTVSEMGSAVTQLALPLTAVVLLKATTFQVGLLTSAVTAAFALIALPAGALVDRGPKRTTMIVCDVARLVIIGWIPVAAALKILTLAQLYVVAILAGVCTVFFDVAYQSYLPALLRREHLMEGNGRIGATESFARLVGPAVGGGLVGAFGAAGAMAADAISYGVSVASLLGIRAREIREPRERLQDRNLSKEIGEGLSFVVRHPILRKVVACTGTANLFESMATAVEIIFLVRVLQVGPALVGPLFAIGALGGIIGGVVSGKLARKIGSARIIWMSILVFGAPQLVQPLAQRGAGVLVFSVSIGFMFFSGVVYNVAQVSYRQSVCPPQLMGRMNAAVRWIVWGTMPLGGIIGGALGTSIGIRPTLWVAVTGSWAAGFWVFFSPLRHMRDVPHAGEEAAAVPPAPVPPGPVPPGAVDPTAM